VYDRLFEVNQGAIVEYKRLGNVLQVAQLARAQRDNRRSRAAPSRSHSGQEPIPLKAKLGTKTQRQLDACDLAKAMAQLTPAMRVG
jgi:hypothetical protein